MSWLDRTDELIVYFVEHLSGRINRTRLVKFLYLADYEARRWLGRPISTLHYSFEHFGPYDKGFPDHLGHVSHLVEEEPCRWIDRPAYLYHFRGPKLEHGFDREEKVILEYIVRKYARMPLSELLDEVVYQTEPMGQAVESGTRFADLDMDQVNHSARREFGSDLKSLLAAKDQLEAGHFRELV